VWKRWFLRALLVTACVAVLVVAFPALVYKPLGLLRHEAFFDGKPTNYWIRALKQETFLGQAPPASDVGKTLREGGPAAVPVLCEIAENPDDDLRTEALRVLALLGPQARDATPVLTAAVKTEDDSSRFMLASEALAGADPAAAAEALSVVLRDRTNDSRRAWALMELLKLAPQGREALPVLQELAGDPKEDVLLRVQALRMLWRLGQPAEPLLAALSEVVTADRSPAGVQALVVLGEMGSAARPALPTLLELLEKPTIPLVGRTWGPPHRAAVIHAVGLIGPEASAVPTLLAFLKTNDYSVRLEVALALANMGPPVKETLAARQAVSWAGIVLLAAERRTNLATLPLVQIAMKTWIPVEGQTREAIREAVLRVDPDSAPRPGGR
jgi:HEAT repeat protein